MLWHYITVTARGLVRHKLYNSAHLYRLELTAKLPGRQGLYKTALTPGPMAKAVYIHTLRLARTSPVYSLRYE